MRKFCLIFALCIYIPVLCVAALSILFGPIGSLIDGDVGVAVSTFLTALVIAPLVATQIFLILHVLESDHRQKTKEQTMRKQVATKRKLLMEGED